MDTFTIFIVILLILSIANNLLMYNKCYISRNLPTYDSRLKSTIGFLPINVYYPYKSGNYNTINEIKTALSKIQNNSNSNLYVTYETTSFDDYIKINEMDNVMSNVIGEQTQIVQEEAK